MCLALDLYAHKHLKTLLMGLNLKMLDLGDHNLMRWKEDIERQSESNEDNSLFPVVYKNSQPKYSSIILEYIFEKGINVDGLVVKIYANCLSEDFLSYQNFIDAIIQFIKSNTNNRIEMLLDVEPDLSNENQPIQSNIIKNFLRHETHSKKISIKVVKKADKDDYQNDRVFYFAVSSNGNYWLNLSSQAEYSFTKSPKSTKLGNIFDSMFAKAIDYDFVEKPPIESNPLNPKLGNKSLEQR